MKRLVALAFILATNPALASEEVCFPKITADKPQFIVGYGSLMETASKQRSSPTAGLSHPVRIKGYQRAWNARGDEIGFSTTYLGVVRDPEREIVAAIYLDPNASDIEGTDRREVHYCRDKVDHADIDFLDGWALPENAEVWIYALKPEDAKPVTERWPIVQSYVDIFITGCQQLRALMLPEKAKTLDFVTECIRTTQGWSEHWVNDRPYPRRAFISQPNASSIDAVLHEELPEYFEKIVIE
jgi:hypothetical protein